MGSISKSAETVLRRVHQAHYSRLSACANTHTSSVSPTHPHIFYDLNSSVSGFPITIISPIPHNHTKRPHIRTCTNTNSSHLTSSPSLAHVVKLTTWDPARSSPRPSELQNHRKEHLPTRPAIRQILALTRQHIYWSTKGSKR